MNKHISANFKYSGRKEQYISKLTVVYFFGGGLSITFGIEIDSDEKTFASVNSYMNFRKAEISLKQLWKLKKAG